MFLIQTLISGADLGGGAGGGPFVRVPICFRYFSSSGVSTNSELAKFCCSQTVKSNILLSPNAGNAISETLDVQHPGGGEVNPGSAPGYHLRNSVSHR